MIMENAQELKKAKHQQFIAARLKSLVARNARYPPKPVPKLASTPELEALRLRLLKTSFRSAKEMKTEAAKAWGKDFILYVRTVAPIGYGYTYSLEKRKNIVEV